MKPFAFLTSAAIFGVALSGCGGAAPEGDTSHLETQEAVDYATEAANAYENAGKDGGTAAAAGLDGGDSESKPAE